MSEVDEFDSLRISLRAHVPTNTRRSKFTGKNLLPSDYTLIFDTETTIDPSQKLKFGVYQVRKGTELFEAGYFINPDALSAKEQALIRRTAKRQNWRFMMCAEFIENVFFEIGYKCRATIVGFNLPFDISRLAIGHGNARGKSMKGGFSFILSPHKWHPRIQIKHLSSSVSLIRFTTRPGQITGRGMRKRQFKPVPRPGYFVDIRALAAALTSHHGNLDSVAKLLGTQNQKSKVEKHGSALNAKYLEYAWRDVQVTWECYRKLIEKFDVYKFSNTNPSKIFSEASLGKAYFREMNIRPWQELQPEFPPEITGIIMSTYFGGRAEVHHRRIISRVFYADFLSMYPTVCTLMNLWKFAISDGMTFRDHTEETKAFLGAVTIDELRDPEIWKRLALLVQVRPDGDILPVRADYSGNCQDNIGLNHLHSNQPLWFTLADCIASKILTGKSLEILKAIIFEPKAIQSNLKSVNIAGNAEYRIDPGKDDFYRRIIDQRSLVKVQMKNASDAEKAVLDSIQLTLKILANATSYGIFVELNVEDLSKPERRNCYGCSGEPSTVMVIKSEEPGKYFHPLIATLITGAARLMLATAEQLVLDAGLDWAFCDTDSIAITKPDMMDEGEFQIAVERIRDWFKALNPYEVKTSILKAEDANFSVDAPKRAPQFEPLYCIAISAKRYALFNQTSKKGIVIRKASAHGLGHLLAPYGPNDAPASIAAPVVSLSEIGVERWHHDLWHQIIRGALDDCADQVDLSFHPNLNQPAASRYGSTTPELLKWFRRHNEGRAYAEMVKPFNFLLSYQMDPATIHGFQEYEESISVQQNYNGTSIRWPRPVAPYDSNTAVGAKMCFDRDTGVPVPARLLKSYKDVLGQYHLHPEYKFLGGDFTDRGITRRRRVEPILVRQIGKEANRWEERLAVGSNTEAVADYGLSSQSRKKLTELLRQTISSLGQRETSKVMGISRAQLSRLIKKDYASDALCTVGALIIEASNMSKGRDVEEDQLIEKAVGETKIIGLSEFARKLCTDSSNLKKTLVRSRPLSQRLRRSILEYFKEFESIR